MMKMFFWNQSRYFLNLPREDTVLWVRDNDPDQMPEGCSPNYEQLAATRLGTVGDLRMQFEQAVANSQELQAWLKERRTLLVVAEVQDDGSTSYTFLANAREGNRLLYPLS